MMFEMDTMQIERTSHSKLAEVDFENLAFGKIFSDHMLEARYENGAWSSTAIRPFGRFSISPANSALHYGQSIFEGLKAHKGADGIIRLFRPDANARRFNISAERMCMPALPEAHFVESVRRLVDLDRDWVPPNDGSSLYIRPFMFASDEYIGVKPSDTYRFVIFTCPVGAYYSKPVHVKIEERYTRAAAGGTGFAKTAGNYAASLLPAQRARKEGIDQLIWTDGKEHRYIEESGTMNVMFRIGDTLITPETSETILESVTRTSVVQLAKHWGYKVEERRVSVEEVMDAIGDGTLKEAFGLGTAATVAQIASIRYRDRDYVLPEIDTREFSQRALSYLDDLKAGKIADEFGWIVEV